MCFLAGSWLLYLQKRIERSLLIWGPGREEGVDSVIAEDLHLVVEDHGPEAMIITLLPQNADPSHLEMRGTAERDLIHVLQPIMDQGLFTVKALVEAQVWAEAGAGARETEARARKTEARVQEEVLVGIQGEAEAGARAQIMKNVGERGMEIYLQASDLRVCCLEVSLEFDNPVPYHLMACVYLFWCYLSFGLVGYLLYPCRFSWCVLPFYISSENPNSIV